MILSRSAEPGGEVGQYPAGLGDGTAGDKARRKVGFEEGAADLGVRVPLGTLALGLGRGDRRDLDAGDRRAGSVGEGSLPGGERLGVLRRSSDEESGDREEVVLGGSVVLDRSLVRGEVRRRSRRSTIRRKGVPLLTTTRL